MRKLTEVNLDGPYQNCDTKMLDSAESDPLYSSHLCLGMILKKLGLRVHCTGACKRLTVHGGYIYSARLKVKNMHTHSTLLKQGCIHHVLGCK